MEEAVRTERSLKQVNADTNRAHLALAEITLRSWGRSGLGLYHGVLRIVDDRLMLSSMISTRCEHVRSCFDIICPVLSFTLRHLVSPAEDRSEDTVGLQPE